MGVDVPKSHGVPFGCQTASHGQLHELIPFQSGLGAHSSVICRHLFAVKGCGELKTPPESVGHEQRLYSLL